MLTLNYHRLGWSSSLALMLCLGGLSNPVFAQPTGSTLADQVVVSFHPPKSGAPDNTVGGATRGGQCPHDNNHTGASLIPVVPGEYAGLTTAERPSFFVYLGNTSAEQLFFSLKSTNGRTIHQAYIPIRAQNGVLRISLPETTEPLEIGQTYRWSVACVCGESLRPSDPTWSYSVQRIGLSPEDEAQLANLSSLDQAAWYGQAGIWYDAVVTLANSEITQEALANAWKSFMLSVDLESVSTAALLP